MMKLIKAILYYRDAILRSNKETANELLKIYCKFYFVDKAMAEKVQEFVNPFGDLVKGIQDL
jgi:hypothetical protein